MLSTVQGCRDSAINKTRVLPFLREVVKQSISNGLNNIKHRPIFKRLLMLKNGIMGAGVGVY